MQEFDYLRFYEKVGQVNGWDFSRVKCTSEGVEWDLYQEVAQRCDQSDLLLDIGTGGGEALLTIAQAALALIGIDQSAGMIETANRNARLSGRKNIRFLQMNADKLQFPEQLFNLVSCRHSPFNAAEAARVLAKGGFFLTQQVSEADKTNLAQTFGRGQSMNADGTLKMKYVAQLQDAGFCDIQSFDYDATEYYETVEDLMFLLRNTPIIPGFGQSPNDFERLQHFIEQYQTDKGIQTNAKRFMIIARK